jgi:hypothetical protein
VWLVTLFTLPANPVRGQETPSATIEHGAFAFPDLSGTRLLTVSDLPQPAVFETALCSDGRRYPVRFERRQTERKGYNGRQTPHNFDNLAGSVFTVLQGKIDYEFGTSCFLASQRLLSSATLLPVERLAEPGECGRELRRQLASSRNRQVVNCWLIGRAPSDRRLVLAEFARQGKDALATLALIDRGRIIFDDFTSVFRGKGKDLWRVDDGGVLSPKGWRVVFLLQQGAFYTLGVSIGGSEGADLTVSVSNGVDRFTLVISDHWYQAPI